MKLNNIKLMLKNKTIYFIMKYIINYIKKYIQKDTHIPSGRWKLEYCHIKLNKKIDLANEDHCGLCNQYITMVKSLTAKNMK